MLWIWLIVGVVSLAILVVVLLRWLAQPIPYRGLLLSGLQRFLDGFLQQMAVGSVFLLEREFGSGFLQLAVVGRDRDHQELEFGLPDAAWCRGRFDLVHAVMKRAGYDCHVDVNCGNADIPRFLRVRIAGNRHELVPTSLRLLELAASELGFGVKDRYTLRMSGPFSSEYEQELARQLEQLGKGDRIARAGAAWLRRSANRYSR
jgi:hypothetical protein